MKVLNKALTKYFAFWCPEENVNDSTHIDCVEVEFVEYERYYLATTRWR